MYDYKARCLRVVDGDTVDLEVDLGFDILHRIRVRIFGIDAPEVTGLSKVAGLESKAYVERWVAAAGDKLMITSIKDRRDKYGRYLADLWYAGDLVGSVHHLHVVMIVDGKAIPYDGGAR